MRTKKIGTEFRRTVPAEVHEVLRAVGVLARDMGYRAYLVGGMVRDLALGRPNTDLDIVVEGDALDLAAAFARRTGSAVKGRTRFGTCKIESRAFGTIDLATARSESYGHPGALPDVRDSDLEADLARRDFTVNAMAVALGPGRYGRLVDPFGGAADLSGGWLRILHQQSFMDDPTRILRGVRFAARFGLGFEPGTLALLRACLGEGCLDRVSGKRVFTELRLICTEESVLKALGLLGRFGIMESIDPALGRDPLRARHMKRLAPALARVAGLAGDDFAQSPLCWISSIFFGLKPGEAERVSRRLDLPGKVRETGLWVSAGLPRTLASLSCVDGNRAYRVVKLIRQVSPEGIVHLYAASGRRGRSLVRAYIKEWRGVSPALDGRRVVALGIKQGPMVGRVLERLLELKLRGDLGSPEDEAAYVKRRVRRAR